MKPKLTLRDLFWLVLVCGLALGWWLDRREADRRFAKTRDDLITALMVADRAEENLAKIEDLLTSKGLVVSKDNYGYIKSVSQP